MLFYHQISVDVLKKRPVNVFCGFSYKQNEKRDFFLRVILRQTNQKKDSELVFFKKGKCFPTTRELDDAVAKFCVNTQHQDFVSVTKFDKNKVFSSNTYITNSAAKTLVDVFSLKVEGNPHFSPGNNSTATASVFVKVGNGSEVGDSSKANGN